MGFVGKMNVVFVTYDMDFGGTESVIATVSNAMVQRENRITIITLVNSPCVYELDKRIKVLPLLKSAIKPEGGTYRLLRKTVNDIHPDAVVIMAEEISSRIVRSLLGLSIKLIVSERSNPYMVPVSKINRFYRSLFYRFADGFIFQTKDAASFFSDKIRKKGAVILNPLDISRIPKRPYPKIRQKTVVSVGKLAPNKNPMLMLESFRKFYKIYPEYKLLIYGDGELKQELMEYARRTMYPDSYQFMGTTSEVLDEIFDAGMFVSTADYEGIPSALVEAMACGIPCIATDCPVGGPRMLIQNGVNGLLVPIRESGELVRAMCKIADENDEIRNIGINARTVAILTDPVKITREWENYIRKVVSDEPSDT